MGKKGDGKDVNRQIGGTSWLEAMLIFCVYVHKYVYFIHFLYVYYFSQ